jgi:lipopolysaccharide export system protein LptC
MSDAPERDLLVSKRRVRRSFAATGVYRRMVRYIRVVLIVGVAAIVATIFLWPEIERTAPRPKNGVPPVASNELVKPRFESIDHERQPYTVTADRAVQNANDPDLIELDQPIADMTMKDGTWVALEADRGLYMQEAQKIDLSGHVRVFQDDGYELKGNRLLIDVKAQTVTSPEPVTGHGPVGKLTAARMNGNGANGVLVFHGPATLTLNQSLFE